MLLWTVLLAVLFVVLNSSYRVQFLVVTRASEEAGHDLRMRLTERVRDPGGISGAGSSGERLSIAGSDARRAVQVLWVDAAVAQHRAGDTRAIRLAAVHHAYVDEHPVLHGIDLRVEPGERVALIGTTGAGKTTIARIAAGLEPPTHGAVEVGGDVGLVTQEVHVFAGTLAADLRLAKPDATDDQLKRALDLAGARWGHELLDTHVGEGGHALTAAQAQQVALARLALHDPPVAILDEAGAEAGSAGARTLESAAARVLDGRTALVIAHRLTQASTADRIVVLEHGRVVEQGTHEQLLASRGTYAQLWEAWRA